MMDNIDLQIMKEFIEIVDSLLGKLKVTLTSPIIGVDKRIKRMKEKQIIDKFITIVNHEVFGYKKIYLLISEVNNEQKNRAQKS